MPAQTPGHASPGLVSLHGHPGGRLGSTRTMRVANQGQLLRQARVLYGTGRGTGLRSLQGSRIRQSRVPDARTRCWEVGEINSRARNSKYVTHACLGRGGAPVPSLHAQPPLCQRLTPGKKTGYERASTSVQPGCAISGGCPQPRAHLRAPRRGGRRTREGASYRRSP